MTILEAIIFGIVEGITEFLPVSSTGHLMLTAELLGNPPSDFLKSFEIAIQLGAMLSIIVLYGKSFLRSPAVWRRIITAFVPTAIVGAVFYNLIKTVFLESYQLVLWMLFTGGVILILFDLWHKEENTSVNEIARIPYRTAIMIGLFQSLAIIPGVSRSAATIIGGLALGVRRKAIVEFSFLLALPTMFTATGYDMFKSAHAFVPEQMIVLGVGFIVSFLVAILSVKLFIHYVQRHNFVLFGIYRMVVAVGWWVFGK